MKQIQSVKISNIIPYENNPRKNGDAIEFVANSIKKFGFQVPLVLDDNGVIVCGHTRYEAAKRLGITEVPCVIASELSPEQIKAFRIADNSTAAVAQWDVAKLDIELKDIEFDMSQFGLGFHVEENGVANETEKSDNYDEKDSSLPDQRIIKYKKTIIPYSEDEEYMLDKALNQYISTHGTVIGFIDAILRGGPYD